LQVLPPVQRFNTEFTGFITINYSQKKLSFVKKMTNVIWLLCVFSYSFALIRTQEN